MKINKTAFILAIALILLLGLCWYFWPTSQPVVAPERSGSFPTAVNPTPIAPAKPQIIMVKGERVEVPAEMNMDLFQTMIEAIEAARTAKDSAAYYRAIAKQLEITANALAVNRYERTFEDKKVKLTIKATTEGKLTELQPDWVMKPDTIQGRPSRKILIGPEAGINIKGQPPGVGAALMYQSPNGHQIKVGYDTNGTVTGGYYWDFDF